MKKLIYIITAFLCVETYAAGNIGVSGADFLELGVGSRPLGMGEAFTAMSEDVNALYYNPASLGTQKYPELSINHQELILDSRMENITAVWPVLGGFGAFSSTFFWVPRFEKVDIDGNSAGQVNFYNSASTLAWGKSFGSFYTGAAIKYIYQKVDTNSYHSIALDAGVLKSFYMYTPFSSPARNFYLGLSLNNIGTDVAGDPLPRNFKTGISYITANWMRVNVDFSEYLIEATDIFDFTYGFDENFQLNTGLEFNYDEILYFRTGYKFNDGTSYSFGVGFNYAIKNVAFRIDASYSDADVFGSIYTLNFTVKLIPKVITTEDKILAEKYYKAGIKAYIAEDIDGALANFEKVKAYNPYYKSIDQKISDLKELKKLKEQNKKFDDQNEEKTIEF
ncbi:MAG: PorV/PorQ family protein [Spirochaetes bacterium]|nr:PorV/PorQ family protein [Spirochaetota bacterium]